MGPPAGAGSFSAGSAMAVPKDADGSGTPPRLWWLLAAALAGVGFVLTFLAFRPGIMTPDSFSMWNMGVTWRFHDHHHPLIGLMLGVSRLVAGDPSAYLALQLGLWWGGALLFAVAWRERVGWWALAALLVGFTPPALSLMGYIHKTPLLTSCFLFAVSWLFVLDVRRRRPGPWTALVVLPLLFVGAVARGYSYASAVPILVYGAWLMFRGRRRGRASLGRCVAVALVVTVGIVVLDRVLVYDVLRPRRAFKVQTIYRFDLAAIHALTGRTYAEDSLRPAFSDREAAMAFYRQHRGLWRIIDMYRPVRDPDTLRELRREWLRAIRDNPRAYLRHRWNAISRSLGLRERVWGYRRFDPGDQPNPSGLTQPESAIRDMVLKQQLLFRDAVVMRPWFWSAADAVLCLVAAVLLVRGPDRVRHAVRPHAAMLYSGLLLLLPYLLVCLDRDARFTYWVTVSTIFGGIGLLGVVPDLLRGQAAGGRGAQER